MLSLRASLGRRGNLSSLGIASLTATLHSRLRLYNDS